MDWHLFKEAWRNAGVCVTMTGAIILLVVGLMLVIEFKRFRLGALLLGLAPLTFAAFTFLIAVKIP